MVARKTQNRLKAQCLEAALSPLETLPSQKGNRLCAMIGRWFKRSEMTFEQWEKLERKYSPQSSHHAQLYYRDLEL